MAQRSTHILLAALISVSLGACSSAPVDDDDDSSGDSSGDSLAPVVAITAPSSGAVVSGMVSVQVEASDDVGVSSVTLSVDGSWLAAATDVPYDFSWDSTAEIDGDHVLEAVASDAAGNSSATSVTVAVDNGGLPVGAVNLTNPVDGSSVCGTITVTASALPAILEVSFSVDGLEIGTDGSSPFEATWDTAAFADGPHVVTAIGQDIDGNQAQASVSVDVENSGDVCDNLPTVVITSPSQDAVANGTLSVTVDASDDGGVRRVEFFLDGGMFFNDEMIPYAAELDTTVFDEGPHGLRAVAYDTAEQSAQQEITVNFDRTPPALSFDSPGALSSVHDVFDVVVSASDNVGLSTVELWAGGDSQGTLSASPYQWSIDSMLLPSGSLDLEATAIDGVGLEATASRSLDVDQLPTINITAPGGTVSAATVTIAASAGDDLGVAQVEFLVDGVPIDTAYDAPWQASWSTCELGDGSRQIEVVAQDTGYQEASDTVSVSVVLSDGDGDGATVCTDCDDGDASSHPGALEVCDGVDNDCSGSADFPGELVDGDGDGSPSCSDCDDSDALRSPGFSEDALSGDCSDGIDNDCDGAVDTDPECTCLSASTAQGMDLVHVCGGTFEMGCTTGQSSCGTDGSPAHTVTLTHDFALSETEVTQGQWQALMGNNQSYFGPEGGGLADCGLGCPVEEVDWWESLAFANAMSVAEGLPECYALNSCTGTIGGGCGTSYYCTSGTYTCGAVTINSPSGSVYDCTGYRLPTEAEWEYAARGGEDLLYSGSDTIDAVGWYRDNSGSTTHPAALKQANAFGLYDMSGNVWEWTQDWYDANYYSSSPSTDPTGPSTGAFRVSRGGSWYHAASSAGAASRYGQSPVARGGSLGFRLSRTVP